MKHQGTIGFLVGVFLTVLLCHFNPSSIKHANIGMFYIGNSLMYQLVAALDIGKFDTVRIVFICLLILSYKGRFLTAKVLHKAYTLLENKK